ncbi:hypothetical protein [Arthrobacter sp. Cr_A7]|uniref:hypothetical protein n=1 Tax=Arthrobacter sp. Cr_A7 TaxID=3031017 RepID=UPI0023DB2E8C|nr:hypothetical protein [Arthrobacter sp. Cr_A7]MDF2051179.1 hypothetical protein [Arthrobacter sp. Cr_A7]
MAFIRRVRTASGATGVQIAEYVRGRQRIVEHVGSAHTEAELGVLLARARELLEDPAQGVLELGVERTPPVLGLVPPASDPRLFDLADTAAPAGRTGPARVVGTDSRVLFDALASVFTALGFEGLGDEVFRDLVIARVVEWRAVWAYSRKRAVHDNKTLTAQENRAREVIEGQKAARTPRFVKTSGGARSLDEASLTRARQLAALKGYVTNIPANIMTAGEVIGTPRPVARRAVLPDEQNRPARKAHVSPHP